MFSRVSLFRSAHLRVVTKNSFRCQSAATTAEALPAAAAAAKTTPAAETTATATTSGRVPVTLSLLAAAAGVVTVSAAAAAVETWTASTVLPYPTTASSSSGGQQRFDQTNYSGRFFRMLLQCDPRLLLYTEEQVRQAKDLIDNHYQQHQQKQGGGAGGESTTTTQSDRVLWEAQRLCESAMNDAGDIVPRPFRMSGFVPYNGPICVAMVSAPSTLSLLFWSWVNQSQNALVNYYNRNASSTMTNETLAQSYVVAVGSALAVAFGLATAIQKRYAPAQAQALMRYVAFPSAVVASSLNCYIVRSPEIESGIPLQNAAGENVAPHLTSNVAATQGVYATTASRALLQAPVYFLPPVLLSTLPIFRRYLARAPHMTVPLTTYLLLVSFGVGLPATVAVFPQISAIPASQVEERFRHLRDPQTNQPYETFYYNKGL